MSIQFRNDGRFLLVIHSDTGVITRIAKANLVIREDNATSFFLKNDSYIEYFVTSTVAIPVASSTSTLVKLLVAMAQSDSEATSALDHIQQSQPVLNLIVPYHKNSLEIDEIVENGAISIHDATSASVTMTIPNTTTDPRIVRQSREYIRVSTGQSMIGIVCGTLINDISISNVISRIGIFDDVTDSLNTTTPNGYGMFFEYDSSYGLSLVLRSTNVVIVNDERIRQAQWNLDRMDGTGLSTAVLDPTKSQTFVFRIGSATQMSLAAGFLYDGQEILVHQFVLPTTYNFSTIIPIRWELMSHTGTTVSSMAKATQSNASIYALHHPPSSLLSTRIYSYSRNNGVHILQPGETKSLVNIRLKTSSIRAKIVMKAITFLNLSSGGVGNWELRLNPTFPSATTFTSADTANTSYAEISEDVQDISDGLVISSGYMYDVGEKTVPLPDLNKLLASITGIADVLCLTVKNIAGSLHLRTSITWQEYE
jgi:hypothetical protein